MHFLEKLVNALFTVHGRTKRWHKVVSVMGAALLYIFRMRRRERRLN